MKLVCDCGNEMEFNPIDPDTNEKYDVEAEYGNGDEQYVETEYSKFAIWAEHDSIGIKCQVCKKDIWFFC